MGARHPGRVAPGTVSLRDAVTDLFDSLRAAVTTRLRLVAIEGQRARGALVRIAVLGVVAAILGISAWLVALWGITWGLLALGLQPWVAVVVVIAANVIGALGCVLAMKRIANRLAFPATMRHLRTSPFEPSPFESASFEPEKQRASTTGGSDGLH